MKCSTNPPRCLSTTSVRDSRRFRLGSGDHPSDQTPCTVRSAAVVGFGRDGLVHRNFLLGRYWNGPPERPTIHRCSLIPPAPLSLSGDPVSLPMLPKMASHRSPLSPARDAEESISARWPCGELNHLGQSSGSRGIQLNSESDGDMSNARVCKDIQVRHSQPVNMVGQLTR